MFKTILSIVDRHRLRCDRFHRDCPSSIRHTITSTAVSRKYRRCSPEHQIFDRYLRRFKSRVLSAANMRSDYRCRRAHRPRIRTFDPRAYTQPTPDGNAAEECDLALLNHTINHVPHSEALKLILNPRGQLPEDTFLEGSDQREGEPALSLIPQDTRQSLVRCFRKPPESGPFSSLVEIQRIAAHRSPMTATHIVKLYSFSPPRPNTHICSLHSEHYRAAEGALRSRSMCA